MFEEIVAVMSRSDTLVQDFAGASALFVLLMAGLYLPAF